MLTNRPNRDPDVQGANLRVSLSKKKKPLGSPCLEYELYYKRETTEEWVIPSDSTFDLPSWFDVNNPNIDFVAWTENRGTNQRPDYEWLYVMRAKDYFKSKETPFTKKVKHKIQIEKITTLQNNFNSLFEEMKTIINDNYDDDGTI